MFVTRTFVNILRVSIVYLIINPVFPGVSQVFLSEGFESGARPDGWTEEFVSGSEPWRFRNGGHSPNDNNWLVPAAQRDITRNPPSAAEGIYNAIFFKQGDDNERTILSTPELNLLGGADIELSFYICQVPWTFEGSSGWDVLRVYYKVSESSPWVLLHEYLDPLYTWTQQSLLLPNASSTYYIGFEGHTRWGYGTCLDNIKVESKGLRPYWIKDISFQQLFPKSIPSGSMDVPLMRVDFTLTGNSGIPILDNIDFISLNTSDGDILNNGVKLYSTTTQKFSTERPLSGPVNFVSGVAGFRDVNYTLPPGQSYLWLTCDINPGAIHGNTLDVKISPGGILANDTLYPAAEVSPEGYRIIYGTRFFENFESDHNWTLDGEFEVNNPSGAGGSPGNPDPVTAFSGNKVLGTDLTGLGAQPYNYENDIGESASYHAVSPAIDLQYCKNINIFFQRYFNIEVWDKTSVEVSTDDGTSWHEIWKNSSYINDFQWVQQMIPVPENYWRTNSFRMRFKLGPTDAQNSYSGLNIDDIYVTGEFINRDAGVSEWIYPMSGPVHSSSDSVTVRISNYGGAEITDPVPVSFSLDGGQTWTTEIMDRDIPPGGSVVFTFRSGADLSVPGPRNAKVKTALQGDQSPENDAYSQSLYIVPTFKPPYKETFESNDGYWRKGGNEIWEYGTPAGNIINSALSGSKSWSTGVATTYGDLITRKHKIIFSDDYETDAGWIYTGEFERNIPDFEHLPYFASSGYYCIGTDLSGRGTNQYQYENSVSANSPYTATSPSFDTRNYSNLTLSFSSWITIRAGDSIKLEVSNDNGTSWSEIWKNSEGAIIEDGYNYREFMLDERFNNCAELKVRFSLFSSSASNPVAQGWCIDDFLLTGNLVNNEDAYLVSPVFDFTGINNPVFESGLWYDTEAGMDGVTLQYSLNNGTTWNSVSGNSIFDSYWNWYSGKFVSALESDGWSGNSNGWITVRHLLPSILANNPAVQFRLKFSADLINNDYDGISVDDTRIIDAPPDLGIVEIVSPSSGCEIGSAQKFTVRLKNNSIRSMKPGEMVHAGYKLIHSGITSLAEEIIPLPQELQPGGTLDLQMSEEFDFSVAGEYQVKIFTIANEPFFYSPLSNDTIHKVITVNKPYVDLGPDLATMAPGEVILNAFSGITGYSYLWHDGSADSVYHVTGPGRYYVRVTDTGTGCIASDTIVISRQVADVSIESFLNPYSACMLGNRESIKLSLKNTGTHTLMPGDSIIADVKVNSDLKSDIHLLTREILPGDTLEYTFPTPFDFSVPGNYLLEIKIHFREDFNSMNDTINYKLEVYGKPEIDLGNDIEILASEYTLSVPAGFAAYEWQDGSGSESFVAKRPGKNLYFVTVTDGNSCTDTDSVYVNLNLTDISVVRLISPANSSCISSDSVSVSVRLKNPGTLPLQPGQSINLEYVFEGGTGRESYLLPKLLMPGDSIDFKFRQRAGIVKGTLYNFRITAGFQGDMLSSNNTIVTPVRLFAQPLINLGEDYRVIAATSYQLDAGPGYLTYRWSDGSTGRTISINTPGINKCSVIATDINGCSATDTTWIMLAVPDIGITAINDPATSCAGETPRHVSVSIMNTGNWDIDPSAVIYAAYSLTGQPEVRERITLNSVFKKGAIISYTFSKDEIFRSPGQYTINASVIYESDLAPGNNSTNAEFTIKESPGLSSWNVDTLNVSGPVTLNVPAGYTSYRWQDGSQGNSYQITQPVASLFSVEVTAENGCKSSDSIYVIFDSPDIGITRIIAPVTGCGNGTGGTMPISFEIINNGYLPVPVNKGIKVSYNVNGGVSHERTIFPGTPLLHLQRSVITFESDYIFPAAGSFRLSISLESDDRNLSNNNLVSSFTIFEKPHVEISGEDTLKYVTVPLKLDAGPGFSSYYWQDGSRNSGYEVKSEGLYRVRVTDLNGCSSSDSVLVITGKKDDFPGRVKIYPVPASEVLHINVQMDTATSLEVEFFNFNSILYRENFRDVQSIYNEIEVRNYPPGIYFLRIRSGKFEQTSKIILY